MLFETSLHIRAPSSATASGNALHSSATLRAVRLLLETVYKARLRTLQLLLETLTPSRYRPTTVTGNCLYRRVLQLLSETLYTI